MVFRLSLTVLMVGALAIRGGEEERRTFAVRVDNKPVGSHQIVIQLRDDKTVTVTCQADVTVRVALITYRYSFRGTEVWKEGKLHQFSSNTNDNGKKHDVTASANKEGFAVRADGKDFQIKGAFWLTTYWKLPAENQRGPNVALFDADSGKLINAKMEKVGVEKITVLGKAVDCAHYKLSGGVQADLWYDGTDRLVRQDSVDQGHRAVLELSRLQRE
jgi:hypothetical protein